MHFLVRPGLAPHLRGTPKAAGAGNDPAPVACRNIHWIRHGETEMNVQLGRNKTPSANFVDPLLYDTRLTAQGIQQAQHARSKAELLQPKPEVLLSSPLTRALHTAQLMFPGPHCSIAVEPLCSERVWLSSDIGRQPQQLRNGFRDVDFSKLEDFWWHNDGSGDLKHIQPENEDQFLARMQLLRGIIDQRAESVIAIVTHYSVLKHMTGCDLSNGEIWSCEWRNGHCIAAF